MRQVVHPGSWGWVCSRIGLRLLCYLVTCHACGAEHPGDKLVTLPDGSQASNYSEEYRSWCEAKWVMARLPDKATKAKPISKKIYLNNVEKARGFEAMKALRRHMLFLLEQKRGGGQPDR